MAEPPFVPERELYIRQYLQELDEKYTTDEKLVHYRYSIQPGPTLIIKKFENDNLVNEMNAGRLTLLDPKRDLDHYYIDFKKSKVRVIVYFFM